MLKLKLIKPLHLSNFHFLKKTWQIEGQVKWHHEKADKNAGYSIGQ